MEPDQIKQTFDFIAVVSGGIIATLTAFGLIYAGVIKAAELRQNIINKRRIRGLIIRPDMSEISKYSAQLPQIYELEEIEILREIKRNYSYASVIALSVMRRRAAMITIVIFFILISIVYRLLDLQVMNPTVGIPPLLSPSQQ